MKKQNVSQLMVLTLSLELILSPLAMANGTNTPPPADQQTTTEKSSTTDLALGVLSIGAGVMQKINQANYKDASYYTDLAGFTKQQTPLQDKYFSANKLMQLPGLNNYLALNNINPNSLNCTTLPTTLHEAEPEVCRVGVLSDNMLGIEGQLKQATAYASQYQQIEKLYKNYSSTSNVSGQGFGLGCMKNAMQVLQGYFAYRLDELDKLTTNLEAINNQFKEASKADLNAIEEATAVLEGGDSELVAKARNSKPELFDFAGKFNNPACNSIMSGEGFNGLGGLNKINKNLKEQLTAKQGKFSGETYLDNHQAVVEDIKKMAASVAKQVELNFTSLVAKPGETENLFKVSANHGLNGALGPDLIADKQIAFQEKNKKLQTEISIIANELGPRGQALAREASNPHSGAFSSQLSALETSIKNECLRKLSNMDSLIDNVYDASVSNFANKNASSFLKDKLQQIVGDEKSSFSKKMAELQAIEKQYANYYVKMQNSYEVQEVDSKGNLVSRVIPASTRRTPSAYLSDVIRSCEAQFKSNHLSNQVTGAEAVKKLRSIHSEYKSLAKNHANDIKNEITSKLIECSSGVDANTSANASCNPSVFNTSSSSFCANAALSCSKNMKSCSEQADKFVKEIKADRTARVNNYKALVEKNKQDIVKIFDTALSQYMKEGEYLRGLFGVGFTSPKDIVRNTDHMGEGKYLSSLANIQSEVDGRLLLEDPEKFVEIFKGNIDKLRESVAQQQDQIIGGDGILGQHIAQTERNYEQVHKQAEIFGRNCQKNYDKYVQGLERTRGQQQKELQELGEKGAEFCARWSSYAKHPYAACQSDFQDLGKIAAKVDPRAVADFQSLSEYCAGQNMGGGNTQNDAYSICRAVNASENADSEIKAACTKLADHSKNGTCSTTTPGTNGSQAVTTDVCGPLKEYIAGSYNHNQSQDNKDGTVSNTYCTASNGSQSSNKALNFMNSLARELGVQSAGTLRQ